jgi:hypothetical protein
LGRPDRELPRWPFESFWEGLTTAKEHDRWSVVNAALIAIDGALEVRRDLERLGRFEAKMGDERKAAARQRRRDC